MALRKFLYIDPTYGYHDEQDAADSLSMGDLTLDASGAGDGTLTLTGGGTIRGLPTTPSNSDEATSKAYVDSLTSGVSWRPPVITMEVISDLLSAPPVSPADGDSYVTIGQSGGPFAITAVNTGAKTFTVTGDHSSLGAGDIILVQGSTGNDGYYTVVSATYTTSTDIVVSEVVPDGTADGTVDYCDPGTAWDTIGPEKIVCYDGSTWDEIRGSNNDGIQDGDRVVVKESGNGGSFTDASAIYQYNGSSWVVSVPEDGWAVLVQDYDHVGYWDNTGWTYELSNDDWVQFTGTGQINAGAGLTKSANTLDVGDGDGITVSADAIAVDISGTNPGLEYGAGVSPAKPLQVKVSGSEGIVVNANGVAIEIDDTPDTLDVDADGLKVVGLPSLFKVNDVAVGATVTAANLDELTDGSSGVTIHTHTPPAGVEYADRVEDTHENQAAVTTGFVVRWGTVNNQIQHADNATAVGARAIGVARVGGAISPGTSEIVKHGVAAGVLTPHADSFAVNDEAFLGASGAIRLYANVPRPGRIIRMGFCKNAADLDVQISDLGRARA